MHPICSVVAAVICASSSVVQADPLTPNMLPRDTRWVLHADVDAGRAAAPLWNMARERFFEPRRAELLPRLTLLERVTGMRPAQDLKDVTLYGNSYDENAVCIRIHGLMDKESLISFLKADGEYREAPYGSYTILSWRDRGRDRLMYASFATADVAYLATTAKDIQTALDTQDKKTPTLAADSALVPNAGQPGKPIFWMAGMDLAELQRKQKTESPVLSQMEAASMGIRWVNQKASMDFHVVAKNEKVARQLPAVAEGGKALAMLAGSDEHAGPGLKLVGEAFSQLTISTDGREMKGDWPIGLDKIEAVLDLAGHEMVAVPAAKQEAAANRKP